MLRSHAPLHNDHCISWISGVWVLRWLVGFDVPLRWAIYCLVGMWLGAAFLRGNKHVGRLEYGRVGCQLLQIS